MLKYGAQHLTLSNGKYPYFAFTHPRVEATDVVVEVVMAVVVEVVMAVEVEAAPHESEHASYQRPLL